MAIQFARIELVGRSTGGNACCKGSYNARTKIKDEKTGVTYNFERKGDNVYHAVLLPDGVDPKFKNPAILMNEVERSENRKNSSLLKDIVIALPDDKELTLQDRINISHLIIDKMEWVKEGLGVQLDIHSPHDGENNWHAHVLLTKRRFAECGTRLGAKARDLDIEVRGGANPFGIPEEQMIHETARDVINDYFKSLGLENRVDAIGINPQEHIGPVRMRSVLNGAAERNEERRIAEVEHLNSGSEVLKKVTRHMSVFSKNDLIRAVKCIPNTETANKLVENALSNKNVIELFNENGKSTGYYTTTNVREEELKLLRLSSYIAGQENLIAVSKAGKANKLVSSLPSNSTNQSTNATNINTLIEAAKISLSAEQHIALSHLLLANSGIRIMRGRAGTGKSHVLGKIASISKECDINIIGLAPTHKAKGELTKCGFEKTDTIKGMLFKLYNGKFELPKNSLIVVDEAGMVGSDDYRELLKTAARRKCNVILSGDERQLASVQRGGMFEVFADRYGSTHLLDIKRQDSDWGKSVAMAFSKGEVRSGIEILAQNDKIISSGDKISGMNALLSDWNNSKQSLDNKTIIAVKNKDVAALNHGARQYLKTNNTLTGPEIEVAGNHYMQGDRILIKQTNKDLNLTNGDLAKLTYISNEKFTIETATGKEISFDPSKYSGFRHGYATTVFKAQGISINDVFVLHDGFGTIRNSYVALSRNIKDLKLYINNQTTKSTEHLIKQLSYDPDSSSSLNYFTKDDLIKAKQKENFDSKPNKGIFAHVIVGAMEYGLKKLTEFSDKNLAKADYYNFKVPTIKKETVEEVLDKVYEESEQKQEVARDILHGETHLAKAVGSNIITSSAVDSSIAMSNNVSHNRPTLGSVDKSGTIIAKEIKPIVGNNHLGNNRYTPKISSANSLNEKNERNNENKENKTKLSSKERFYAKADYKRNLPDQRTIKDQLKDQWDKESIRLRAEIKFKAESIARELLGEPNKKLSNGKTLRFGDTGKLAVRISGERAGSWYDFSEGKGGDIFDLVQDKKGCDFKGAADYLRGTLGIESSVNHSRLALVYDHNNRDLTEQYIKDKEAKERETKAKQAQITKLYARSKDITTTSIATKYLTQARAITCALSQDIKTAGIFDHEKNKYFPALIAFARDVQGNITGGQQILLNPKTGAKAATSIPKKSFGKIAGSFVDIGEVKNNDNVSKITIIAEGLETALSVKQAFMTENIENNEIKINAKILCSLGISNIGNYKPSSEEKIIIAADNDGAGALTNKTIENAKTNLQKQGSFVEIVRPNIEGDFNDVLKAGGIKQIQKSFEGALARLSAKTLSEYIVAHENISLDKLDKENLKTIEHYNIAQEKLVNAWRADPIQGKLELESMRKGVDYARTQIQENKPIVDLAKNYGIKLDEKSMIQALAATDTKSGNISAESYCIKHILDQFVTQKQLRQTALGILDVIKKEDTFLSEIKLQNIDNLDTSLKSKIELAKSGESKKIIEEIKQNLEANNKQGLLSDSDLSKALLAPNIKDLANNLQEIANNGRNQHLGGVDMQLTELAKLAYKYDKDALVDTLKSMTYTEKQQYINRILAAETKKYVDPILARFAMSRENAANSGDFNIFLKATMHEQEILVNLYNRHNIALYTLDKQSGDLKLSVLTKSAYDLQKRGSKEEIIKTIDYTIKHNITEPKSIIQELKHNGGNLKPIYDSLRYKCNTHEATLAQNNRLDTRAPHTNTKDHDHDKQPEINDKHIGGPKL